MKIYQDTFLSLLTDFPLIRCKPYCGSCTNGTCTAPNKCDGSPDYQFVNGSKTACEPTCKSCENGHCTTPDIDSSQSAAAIEATNEAGFRMIWFVNPFAIYIKKTTIASFRFLIMIFNYIFRILYLIAIIALICLLICGAYYFYKYRARDYIIDEKHSDCEWPLIQELTEYSLKLFQQFRLISKLLILQLLFLLPSLIRLPIGFDVIMRTKRTQ